MLQIMMEERVVGRFENLEGELRSCNAVGKICTPPPFCWNRVIGGHPPCPPPPVPALKKLDMTHKIASCVQDKGFVLRN